MGVRAQAERVRLRVGDGLRRALQQRHPRPGQVRHRGDPLRLRPDDRPDARRRSSNAFNGLRNDICAVRLHDSCRRTDGRHRQDRCTSGDRGGAVQPFIDLWTTSSGDLANNGGPRRTSSRSGPTSSARTCSRATSTARPGTAAPTSSEIVDNVTEQFRNYYVFNAYKRGRTNWRIDGYLNRLEERYFNRYSEAFQFFFFLLGLHRRRPRQRSVPGVGRCR